MIETNDKGGIVRYRTVRVAFVEGDTDKAVADALFKHHQIAAEWDVVSLRDNTAWPTKIMSHSNIQGFEHVRSVLLIRDADDGRAAVVDAIRRCCSHLGWPDPTQDAGGIGHSTPRSVGYHIWAGADGKGELEDVCLLALGDRLGCVDNYFECLRLGEDARKESKRRLQAYLAGHNKYCPGIRAGAGMGLLAFESAAWAPLVSVAKQLS